MEEQKITLRDVENYFYENDDIFSEIDVWRRHKGNIGFCRSVSDEIADLLEDIDDEEMCEKIYSIRSNYGYLYVENWDPEYLCADIEDWKITRIGNDLKMKTYDDVDEDESDEKREWCMAVPEDPCLDETYDYIMDDDITYPSGKRYDIWFDTIQDLPLFVYRILHSCFLSIKYMYEDNKAHMSWYINKKNFDKSEARRKYTDNEIKFVMEVLKKACIKMFERENIKDRLIKKGYLPEDAETWRIK